MNERNREPTEVKINDSEKNDKYKNMKSKMRNWRDNADFVSHYVQDIDMTASLDFNGGFDMPTRKECFKSLYNSDIIKVLVDMSNKYCLEKK